MPLTEVLAKGAVTAVAYECQAGPGAPPAHEWHEATSLSFVRRGAFGYRMGRRRWEMVAGSIIVGRVGDDYVCTHEHRCGDACLSFRFPEETLDELGGSRELWRAGALPPTPELSIAGKLAEAAATGRSEIDLEEAGLLFAAAYVKLTSGREPGSSVRTSRARREAVEAALWIEEVCHTPVDLGAVAARAQLSPFHFLRLFRETLGVTPHQYLVQARLRRAAELLAEPERSVTTVAFEAGFGDLSNFMRTFRRATGATPGGFRRLLKGERKIPQVRHFA